uniref:Chromodomain-helicase-DNA-binding protein 1-like C-terminal domain-containing protein n=1 Tax=Laticauda laticaudata TaxID=8630 RepID=A0A8C5S4Y0_LATLA
MREFWELKSTLLKIALVQKQWPIIMRKSPLRQCKEYLRPFKKTLQRLNLPKDYPKERKLICTRKTLNILGDHINMFLLYNCKSWELKHWKKMLWRFVSLFSTLDEKQLYKLYRYSKTDQFTKFLLTLNFMSWTDRLALPTSPLPSLESPQTSFWMQVSTRSVQRLWEAGKWPFRKSRKLSRGPTDPGGGCFHPPRGPREASGPRGRQKSPPWEVLGHAHYGHTHPATVQQTNCWDF